MEEALENDRREGHNDLSARFGRISKTQRKVEKLSWKIREAMRLEISCSPDELRKKIMGIYAGRQG